MYNPDCEMCGERALQDWVRHLEYFTENDCPKSHECELDGVSWLDLMHYDSTYPALDAWDNVNGQYHTSMDCPIYRAESSLRAGYAITRDLLDEYIEELKTNL